MTATILIPARMAATRFPGKPLVDIAGKPMIQWVYEQASAADIGPVIVATDSPEIFERVRQFGGEARMTREDHQNGTQRVAEIAGELDVDQIINVQGDEPLIEPKIIRAVAEPLKQDPTLAMSTLATPIRRHEDIFNPNIVKVVRNAADRALYFSRAPIPYRKHTAMSQPRWDEDGDLGHLRHLGIYGYRRDFLLKYVETPPCDIEHIEGLEQLRVLHMGESIHVAVVEHQAVGVDRPEDVALAEALLREKGKL